MSPFPESHLAQLQSSFEEALQSTPVYSAWRDCDPGRGTPILDRFRAMPTVSRRELRTRFPKGFTPQGKDLKAALESGEVELVATSGTTDDRVQVISAATWWDHQEDAQYLKGHPLTAEIWQRSFREAVLTTPVCSAGVCHIGDLKMEERIHQRMLFLNQKADPVHWSDREMVRMVEELNTYKPQAVEADPAYLAALCRFAEPRTATVHQPRYIGLTYEFISRTYLRAIRRVFPDVPIINSYGSTEAGCLTMNCEHGALHPNLEWTHIDVLPLKKVHGGPGIGRVCASVLQNPWLKLLRYETGDLARISDEVCSCGRGGVALSTIEGRLKDVTLRPDGTLVTVEGVDSVLGTIPDLDAYQVTQESSSGYLVRYVPHDERDEAVRRALNDGLTQIYGAAQVTLQRETAINPEPSGKYRLTRSQLNLDPTSFFEDSPV